MKAFQRMPVWARYRVQNISWSCCCAALRLHFWFLRGSPDAEDSVSAFYFFNGFIQGLLPLTVSMTFPMKDFVRELQQLADSGDPYALLQLRGILDRYDWRMDD